MLATLIYCKGIFINELPVENNQYQAIICHNTWGRYLGNFSVNESRFFGIRSKERTLYVDLVKTALKLGNKII